MKFLSATALATALALFCSIHSPHALAPRAEDKSSEPAMHVYIVLEYVQQAH